MHDQNDTEPLVSLRDGSTSIDSRLDRVDDKDERSRDFSAASFLSDKKPRSFTWRPGPTLDQRRDGACVGFAWSHELAARPAVVSGITKSFAREKIYYGAQKIDRFRGGAYPGAFPYLQGTSVLAGAKIVKKIGYMREYRWAFQIEDAILAVGYRGPVVFGCNWYREMNTPGERGFVQPKGRLAGKHCILLYGVKIYKNDNGQIDFKKSYFKFQNSWGEDWGERGSARLKFSDLQKLWDGAESCIPVGRSRLPESAAVSRR